MNLLPIGKNGLILALFALVTTALVAATNHFTAPQIERQEQQQLITTLEHLFPAGSYNNDLYKECIEVTNHQFLGRKTEQRAFIARFNEEPVGIAIETTAPDGYNGAIDIIVGILSDGTVAGVRVLSHKETPGLGDKIELRKSKWVMSFDQQRLVDETDPAWKVKKDGGEFDQFTGATITPRAVVKAVRNTLLYYQLNRERLFTQATRCGEPS
ncbi:electron transport complex subunit RsxG [Corallincola spongiicola]|uniref:Ion-translocating oxidoreductase complex subunit G n=1 Tax=Corallincola spongiicola TaxID=2520508 RepID=A0ABY1WV43_9GAMM|nr:electron transport complex subunit RsxG [Corallincola spongiicola]TAA48585.1 electron transport complex subunit RsxG [Corallincola spongiicola]